MKQLPQQAKPRDLISENTGALVGQPMKSGLEQNHTAHIKGHYSFAQLPAVQQNPQAGSAILAHIQEHIAHDYRLRIQKIMGQELPPEGEPIPPELENKIAMAAAEATEQMLKDDAMKEMANDPTIMVALRGLDIEKQKADEDHIIDLGKIKLDQKQQDIDAADADLDRAAKLRIANINLKGRTSNA